MHNTVWTASELRPKNPRAILSDGNFCKKWYSSSMFVIFSDVLWMDGGVEVEESIQDCCGLPEMIHT